MKTEGREALNSYYILYLYFRNFKNSSKIENRPNVKDSTGQFSDIILDTCMKFKIHPIKTVGEDRF